MEIILSILAGIAVIYYSSKYFFDGSNDLIDSFKYWTQRTNRFGVSRHIDGDFFRELQFFFWITLGILSGYGVHQFLVS